MTARKRSAESEGISPHALRPIFESLEPRLLLDADAAAVQSGTDLFLNKVGQAADIKVFGVDIPVVGEALKNGANFFYDMRTTLNDAFSDLNGTYTGNELVQRALYQAWGPGGKNILVLTDTNGNGIGYDDIAVTEDAAHVQFDLHLATTAYNYETDFNFTFDSGLPILKFTATGNVQFTIGFDMFLSFGCTKSGSDQAYYVDTSSDHEAEISLYGAIPDLTASFAFLTMNGQLTDEDANDDPADNVRSSIINPATGKPVMNDANGDGFADNDLNQNGVGPSEVGALFTLNIKDADTDNRLDVNELNTIELGNLIDANLTGNLYREIDGYMAVKDECLVDINLHLDYNGFGVIDNLIWSNSDANTNGATGATHLPHWTTDFRFAWFLSNKPTEQIHVADPMDKIPVIEFNNITLYLGEFISQFAAPFLKTYQMVTYPADKLLDFLDKPIPILSDLAGEDISVMTLAGYIPEYGNLIQAVDQARRAIENADAFSGDIGFNYGNFTIGSDMRAYNVAEEAAENIVGNLKSLTQDTLHQMGIDANIPDFDVNFDWLAKDGSNSGPSAVPGLSFPILTDPMQIVHLLLGGDANLITFDLPQIDINFNLGLSYAIFPPFLNVGFDVNVDAGIQFGLGYDTAGIKEYMQTKDISDLGDGFYISDHVDANGVDQPEVWFNATFEARAFAGVDGLIEVGVKGGLTANVNVDLHDPNNDGFGADGKLRWDEIESRLATGNPLRLVDASGSLSGYLDAYVWVGLDLGWLGTITLYEDTWSLAAGTIIDFNWNSGDDVQPPVLATLDNGTLYLNMGPRAADRGADPINNKDGDESFVIKKRVEGGVEKIVVSAFGTEQLFNASDVQTIYGEGGKGSDTLRVQDTAADPITANICFYGDFKPVGADVDGYGPGGYDAAATYNDMLYAGQGPVTFYGGPGDDTLSGGPGADFLYGGLGKDSITSGDGNDYIEGGDGNDYIDGGKGDDEIHGGAGDDRLYGNDGNDTLYGDAGNDTVKGGNGIDTLNGGDGDDRIYGGSGSDTIDGGAGQNEITGDSGNDILSGGGDKDIIFGNGGNDILYGYGADDYLFGDNGAVNGATDTRNTTKYQTDADGRVILDAGGNPIPITGTYTTTFVGAQGNDELHGGGGNDVLFGDNGLIMLDASGNVDQLLLMAPAIFGNDDLYGDGGNDTLLGGGGDDSYYFANGWGQDEIREYLNGGNDSMDFSSVTDALTVRFGSITVTDALGDRAYEPEGNVENVILGSGDDTIVLDDGGGFAGRLDGGAGTNTLDYSSYTSSVRVNLAEGWATAINNDDVGGITNFQNAIGGAGDDVLIGDDGANVLTGNAGDDILRGAGGNDTLIGGAGADTLDGGAGDDLLRGGAGGDTFIGGTGNDTVDYSDAPAGVSASLRSNTASNDGYGTRDTFDGVETLIGSDFADNLEGGLGGSILIGGKGNDTLTAAGGSNILYGGDGADNLYAAAGNDKLYGEAGDDFLHGGSGTGELHGGAGNDTLSAGSGAYLLDGGAGNDLIDGGSSRRSFLDYSQDPAGVTVDLGAGFATDGFGGRDTLRNIENAIGSAYNDTLTGDANANILIGGAGDDTINGNAGNDTLEGDAGVNTMYGGTGDDTFLVGLGGTDSVSDLAGTDTLDFSRSAVGITIDLAAGGAQTIDAGGDTITLLSGFIENVIGSPFNDTIRGNLLANVLNGGAGDDVLVGRGGNDTLIGGTGNDTADYSGVPFGVNVSLRSGQASNDGYGARDTLTGIEIVVGSALADTLEGGLQGGTLYGGAGNDTLTAVAGNTVLQGGEGNDTLYGGTGISMLHGGAGNDTLIAGSGADLLDGGAGNDRLDGGRLHTGMADYSGDAAGVTASLALGAATDGSGGHDTLVGLKGIVGSAFNDTLTGDANDNVLVGGAGTNVLTGGAGNDTFVVGAGQDTVNDAAGVDTLDFSRAAQGITIDLAAAGAQTVDSDGHTVTLGGTIENVTGSPFGDTIRGNALANVLDGGAGDDVLVGRGGNDTLTGGVGTDTADYSDSPAGVNVSLRTGRATSDGYGGHDTLTGIEIAVGSAFNDTLEGGPQGSVLFGGMGNDTLIATAGVNGLHGGAGNDTLTAGSGADLLDGGAGNDRLDGGRLKLAYAYYGLDPAGVTVNLAAGTATDGFGGTDTLVNLLNVFGTSYDDTLIGDAGNNILIGGAGTNTLTGGAGNDTFRVGVGTDTVNDSAGVDTLDFSDASQGVTIDLAAAGAQTVDAAGDKVTLNGTIENVTGSAFNDVLMGNAADNVLDGGAGNDRLVGRGGNNTLTGGTGVDTVDYSSAPAGVDVSLRTGAARQNGYGGHDQLSGVENATGSAFDDTLVGGLAGSILIGGAGNDTLTAVAGNNELHGGLGNDTLQAGSGNDSLWGDDGADTLRGGTGSAEMHGGSGDDTLTAGSGHDTLYGEDGNDTLTGGSGVAYLYGGDGNDTLFGGSGNNILNGGAGDDVLRAGSGNQWLDGWTGNDTLYGGTGTARLMGWSGNDTITAGHGRVSMFGETGVDTLTADASGICSIDAGSGHDFIHTAGTMLYLIHGADTDTMV